MSMFEQIKQENDQYVEHTYGRFDLALAQGKNARCVDFDGKEYIDFGSGIGVNSLGFCDEGWIAAVTKQLSTLQHTSNLYYTKPYIETARLLCEKSGMKKVFFANSGAESNEGAIKTARKYSFVKYGPGRDKIITLVNSFHGRTVTTLAATGQDVFHNYFFPFTEGFAYAPAGDLDALKEMLDGTVCGIMIELVQGEGGVLPLDQDYVAQVAQLCRQQDILLIVDEVQTGIGRTGTLYAYQQYGIMPDVVTSAKGLAGGLPIAAVLFGEKAEGILQPGDHATTFGGNPVACAGAIEVLNRMTPEFLVAVKEKGAYMKEKIEQMAHVEGVDGLGLMMGIRLKDSVASGDVVKKGLENGVITLTAKQKVRLLPPLTITYEEIDQGLTALAKTLEEM